MVTVPAAVAAPIAAQMPAAAPLAATGATTRNAQRSPPSSTACTFASRALLERLCAPSANYGWSAYLPRGLHDRDATAVLRRREVVRVGLPQALDSVSASTREVDSTSCASSCTEDQQPESSVASDGDCDSKARNVGAGHIGRTVGEKSACKSEGQAPVQAFVSYLSVAGRVCSLSQDVQGCRDVQKALDLASCDAERRAIAHEFVGVVPKIAKHPHANHVLQKCIVVLPSADVQFMIDELTAELETLHHAARHRYSCRIVQHLLRYCLHEQLDSMVEALLAHAVIYSRHAFASYVMQQLAEHARLEQRYRFVRILERNAAAIVTTVAGSRVISTALKFLSGDDAQWLSRAVLRVPGALRTLVAFRNGELAVSSLLSAASGDAQKESAALLEEFSKEHDPMLSRNASLILANFVVELRG